MYSSTPSLTSALDDDGGWSTPHPDRFNPGKHYPRSLGTMAGPVCTGAKKTPPPGFDPRTVQPVASLYMEQCEVIVLSRRKIIKNLAAKTVSSPLIHC